GPSAPRSAPGARARSGAPRRESARDGQKAASLDAGVGQRMVAVELAAAIVALGDAVDAAVAEFEDFRRAEDLLAVGGAQERGVELRGQRIALDTDARLDRHPHRAIGRGHQRRAVDDAAGALEVRAVRQFERALAVADPGDAKAPRPQELRAVEHRLEGFLVCLLHSSSMAMAVASPPPMQ